MPKLPEPFGRAAVLWEATPRAVGKGAPDPVDGSGAFLCLEACRAVAATSML